MLSTHTHPLFRFRLISEPLPSTHTHTAHTHSAHTYTHRAHALSAHVYTQRTRTQRTHIYTAHTHTLHTHTLHTLHAHVPYCVHCPTLTSSLPGPDRKRGKGKGSTGQLGTCQGQGWSPHIPQCLLGLSSSLSPAFHTEKQPFCFHFYTSKITLEIKRFPVRFQRFYTHLRQGLPEGCRCPGSEAVPSAPPVAGPHLSPSGGDFDSAGD